MMRAEAGAASNTIAAYGTDLRARVGVRSAGGLGAASAEAGAARRGLGRCRARHGCAQIGGAPRVFTPFSPTRSCARDDPRRRAAAPGAARALPKMLSTGDVDTYVRGDRRAHRARAAPTRTTCGSPALIELLYGSGLRATELVSLPRNARRRPTGRT